MSEWPVSVCVCVWAWHTHTHIWSQDVFDLVQHRDGKQEEAVNLTQSDLVSTSRLLP